MDENERFLPKLYRNLISIPSKPTNKQTKSTQLAQRIKLKIRWKIAALQLFDKLTIEINFKSENVHIVHDGSCERGQVYNKILLSFTELHKQNGEAAKNIDRNREWAMN